MLSQASIYWNSAMLVDHIKDGLLTFNNYVQRSLVWDNDKKSLLINTLIVGYPVPGFLFVKGKDGIYDAIDGKQRSNAIAGFINGEYVLSDDTPFIEDDDGQEIDITGKCFDELPAWMQKRINNYLLTIVYIEDTTRDEIPQDEIAEIFFRMNNGKALSAIELMRVKAKSGEVFRKIANHEAIKFAVTEAGKRGYRDELIAMQIWGILYMDNPTFKTKDFRPVISDVVVTMAQFNDIITCLDKILKLYECFDPETKEDKKILKRIKAQTHIVSLAYLASKIDDIEVFIDKAKKFFGGTKTTISDNYNDAIGRASANPESIRKRLDAMNAIIG